MIGDTAIFRNREAERSRIRNHPRSGTGRPSYSEARPPESENPHVRRHTIVAVHADTIGREPEISRRFSSRSFDCETERHAYFRRSEVVFVSPAEIPAAPLPYIAFVVRPQIAQSRRSLDAPTLSDRPPVSVCHARPVQASLVPPVGHAQKLHASDIEAGIQEMHAQKVPLGTTAEPMTDFGL